ncbi:MAG: hypothetical protein ABI321_18465, partial [Polyangia bacterium]
MSRALLISLLLGSMSASAAPGPAYRPRAPGFDIKQKKLLTPQLTPQERSARIGVHRLEPFANPFTSSMNRPIDDRQKQALTERVHDSIARLTELDPRHELLSDAEWTKVAERHQFDHHDVRNAAEAIDFKAFDPEYKARALMGFEEIAKGRLARTLSDALAHESPSPERLHAITTKLAAQHPYLGSSFNVEQIIAETRKIHPTLAKWDFREMDDGRKFRGDHVLPASTQAAVTRIGHRAFEGANVLFANHMYADSLAMVDALTALGLDTSNSRFVATPYPFDKRVGLLLEHRGVKVEAAPYEVDKTKKMVGDAVEALLVKARANHGPIVVFDDGGMATQYIAEHHADELYRFRIVEITKAGERVGKAVLPRALGSDVRDHATLDEAQRGSVRDRFIEIRTIDEASKQRAGEIFDAQWRARRVRSVNPTGQLPRSSFGFAYYTYSNTAYKRDVMTPLYTEQVNASLFGAIERGGHPIANKRVAIVGGGAMGIAAARELRTSGYEVTFVEP